MELEGLEEKPPAQPRLLRALRARVAEVDGVAPRTGPELEGQADEVVGRSSNEHAVRHGRARCGHHPEVFGAGLDPPPAEELDHADVLAACGRGRGRHAEPQAVFPGGVPPAFAPRGRGGVPDQHNEHERPCAGARLRRRWKFVRKRVNHVSVQALTTETRRRGERRNLANGFDSEIQTPVVLSVSVSPW